MAPSYKQTQEDGVAALLRGISALLTSEKFTDLIVRCGGRSWKVHKVVVCARSKFFAKACEGKFREAEDGVVELYDDEPQVIDKMLHYMYSNEYVDADTESPPVLFNVRMVAAAEKYFVDHLASIAISKLKGELELDHFGAGPWETEGFANAIEAAYTTTTDPGRQLRDVLLQIVSSHADALFDITQEKHKYFQAMATRTPAFTMEVAGLLAKEVARLRYD